MPRTVTFCLGAGAFLLPLILAQGARAAPEGDYFVGAPWEAPIVRGVEEQRRAEKRRVPVDTLVGRAERAARRDASVVNLYLLARAYGLRAQWHRAEAEETRGEADRARRLGAAERDRASALSTYADVLRQAPRCYFAHHDMGILEMQRETPDTRAAFAHFSNAYNLNRRYAPPQRQLIRLYLQGRQFAEAVPLLRRLLQLQPEDEEARGRLVVALAELGRHDEAYRVLQPMVGGTTPERAPSSFAMQAHLDVQTGRFERAIATYKRLARLNPNVPTAFVGILDCVKAMQKRELEVDLEDYLFALRGIKRLLRDPEEQRKLAAEIERVEHAAAQPPGEAADGAPTRAQLLHALKSPEEAMRIRALAGIMLSKEPASAEVVRAVAAHIVEGAEPSPAVRAGAVRALGRLSGTVLIPLIRLSMRDGEVRVRVEAADTLVGIATRDARAADPVIAILGLYVRDRNVELASSARLGILRLANAILPGLDEDSDDAAHRRAFERWWGSAEGENLLIGALAGYHRIRDKAAHEVLVPYLQRPSFHVARAAYEALARAAPAAGTDALRRWHAAMPRAPGGRPTQATWPELKRSLESWIARRPGP